MSDFSSQPQQFQLTAQHIRAVVCPMCGSKKGERCVVIAPAAINPNAGKPATRSHASRYAKAERYYQNGRRTAALFVRGAPPVREVAQPTRPVISAARMPPPVTIRVPQSPQFVRCEVIRPAILRAHEHFDLREMMLLRSWLMRYGTLLLDAGESVAPQRIQLRPEEQTGTEGQ